MLDSFKDNNEFYHLNKPVIQAIQSNNLPASIRISFYATRKARRKGSGL